MTSISILLIASSLVASQAQAPPSYKHLKYLENRIGTWCHEGAVLESVPGGPKVGTKVTTHISWKWVFDKSAAIHEWSSKYEDGLTVRGMALVAWDASQKSVVLRGVISNGSIIQGKVAYDKATNSTRGPFTITDSDGRRTHSVNVMIATGPDSFTFQQTQRGGGELTGNGPIIDFKRCKPDELDHDHSH